jgi:hypothetical protein
MFAAMPLPVTFRPDFLEQLDGRTKLYRRLKTLYRSMVLELGGPDSITVAEDMLCRHIVFLDGVLSQWQQKYLDGAVPHYQLSKFTQSYAKHVNLIRSSLAAINAGHVAKE